MSGRSPVLAHGAAAAFVVTATFGGFEAVARFAAPLFVLALVAIALSSSDFNARLAGWAAVRRFAPWAWLALGCTCVALAIRATQGEDTVIAELVAMLALSGWFFAAAREARARALDAGAR